MARADSKPRARIRGVRSAEGLSPEAFARWRKDNAALAGIARRNLERPGQSMRDFAAADANGDGSVSAVELADWITTRHFASGRARNPRPMTQARD